MLKNHLRPYLVLLYLQNYCPTPHNKGCIIGGRDKNFENLMQSDQDMRKTRYKRRRLFRNHPFVDEGSNKLRDGTIKIQEDARRFNKVLQKDS